MKLEKMTETEKLIEKAFSSYVIACLRNARKDYFVKVRRHSSHIMPLDAVTFEVNIKFHIHYQDDIQNQNTLPISHFLEHPQLNNKEQKLLYYKYFQDKTDKEIAEILGISRQAVSKNKSKILVKLKSIIDP
ncbi:sigma-70 family RNA polymerase sigma factor [Paenibacillus camerounensis]|uniref:sigma-70 family RNA polymerase sigma factor n=1 Tax=Paenibacillus camerounensis TaxID=1243663 RepID=UPI001FCC9889|nr:sigma-70 family RNA polymerase sigma factor [Paenibacillus camerounensis]